MSLRIEELKFGTIKEVDGASITIKANKLENEYELVDYYVEVGAYVNCGGLHGNTICIVSKVQIEEAEKKIIDENGRISYEPYDLIKVSLAIVGTIENEIFSRGVSRLPIISSNAYLLTANQVNKILGVEDTSDSKNFLVTDEDKDKAYFNLNKLLGRHTAILGTTGSGKSCTVASIIQSILKFYPYPRILFFDLHNEYPSAFGHGKEKHEEYKSKTKCTTWEEFSLPYWFLDLDEFIDIYYSGAGSSQIPIIKKAILELKQKNIKDETIPKDRVSVDSPIYFDMKELINKMINLESEESSKTKKEPLLKIIHRLEGIVNDSRYGFLQKDKELKVDLSEYFKNLFGLDSSEEKYLNILDLSGLPSEVRNVCIGVLSRLCFDYKYWDLDPQDLPLSLVLEEAHTYIPEETSTKFSLAKERIEKIAKEGRKYGLSLVVVTQRPSNISTTVLSQCGTYITLRLTNDNDQNKVRRLLPDTLSGQADILPSLRDGEALVSGDGIILPRKIKFRKPSPFPKSNDIEYHKSWAKEMDSTYSIEKVIRGWKLSEKQK